MARGRRPYPVRSPTSGCFFRGLFFPWMMSPVRPVVGLVGVSRYESRGSLPGISPATRSLGVAGTVGLTLGASPAPFLGCPRQDHAKLRSFADPVSHCAANAAFLIAGAAARRSGPRGGSLWVWPGSLSGGAQPVFSSVPVPQPRSATCGPGPPPRSDMGFMARNKGDRARGRNNDAGAGDALWGRVVWLGLVLAWAFVVASLMSFDRADPPSAAAWPVNHPVQNWCGPVGAYLAYAVLRFAGWGAWFLLALAGLALAQPLFARKIEQPIVRTVGVIMLLVSLCALSALAAPRSGPVGHLPGGELGLVIAREMAARFGGVGAALWMILLALVGLPVPGPRPPRGTPKRTSTPSSRKYVREQAAPSSRALRQYRIDGEVVGIESGPVITLYDVRSRPAPRSPQLTAVSSDIARALKAVNIRIVPTRSGATPSASRCPTPQGEGAPQGADGQPRDSSRSMKLPMFLGKDAQRRAADRDLTKMPHMLIAGTTGSGKSVCMNTIIMSFLYTKKPSELKLVLVDPKMVEMSQFKDIPHLMCPVVTEMSKAAAILEWACPRWTSATSCSPRPAAATSPSYNDLTWEELKERFNPQTPRGADPAQAALHGLHHRRARRPDDDQQGGRGSHHPHRAEGPRRRHPPHPRDAAPAGQRRHGPHQEQHALPHHLQGRQRHGLAHRPRPEGRRAAARPGRHAVLSPALQQAHPRPGHAGRRQGDPARRPFMRDIAGPSFERQLIQLRSGRIRHGPGRPPTRSARRQRFRTTPRRRSRRPGRPDVRPRGRDRARDPARQRVAAAAAPGDRLHPRQPPHRPHGHRRHHLRPQGLGRPRCADHARGMGRDEATPRSRTPGRTRTPSTRTARKRPETRTRPPNSSTPTRKRTSGWSPRRAPTPASPAGSTAPPEPAARRCPAPAAGPAPGFPTGRAPKPHSPVKSAAPIPEDIVSRFPGGGSGCAYEIPNSSRTTSGREGTTR
jgi:hypothetical protein